MFLLVLASLLLKCPKVPKWCPSGQSRCGRSHFTSRQKGDCDLEGSSGHPCMSNLRHPKELCCHCMLPSPGGTLWRGLVVPWVLLEPLLWGTRPMIIPLPISSIRGSGEAGEMRSVLPLDSTSLGSEKPSPRDGCLYHFINLSPRIMSVFCVTMVTLHPVPPPVLAVACTCG
ncbi:hypothetical protein B0J14DRAFT_368807 [Halenospora varia]|nr:hypothetical protein B0J14DRAFT_368807 [Halenospora varia]